MKKKKCLLNDSHFCSDTRANKITCDYFSWEYLKAKVFEDKSHTLDV